jgi:hypothetical protein
MTIDEAQELIAVLMAVYPKHPVQTQTPRAYAMVMRDISVEDAMGAAEAWMRTSPHFPTPADLIGILAEARAVTPAWEDAWAEVMRTMKTWGPYITHQIHPAGPFPGWSSDALAAAVQAAGGYEAICMCEMDKLPTLRAQFRDFFKARRERELTAIRRGPALPAGDNVRPLREGAAD